MSSALVARHDGMMLAVPVGNLDAYINAVSSVPVLSAEEETELAWRFRRDNERGGFR